MVEMGSNRVLQSAPSVASTSQTHTPCGSSLLPMPTPDCSSSLVKSEPTAEVDIALTVSCHSGNWEESYQDLSPWCSVKTICSPVLCQSPATDESPLSGSEFQGEIDFDLRKSEEIASVPLEEDSSCNWWGAVPHESAATSTAKSGSVLINDCWLYENEAKRRLESDRTSTVTTTSPATSDNFSKTSTASRKVEEKEVVVREEMNPNQTSALPDVLKMELQQSLERVASHLQPGGNSRIKAADLMKILQEQMAMLNKKYRAPAAVSDLLDRASPQQADGACSSLFSSSDNSEDFFKFDPFENLFSPPVQSQSAQQPSDQFASELLAHPANAAPAYVQSAFHPVGSSASSQNGSTPKTTRGSDVFGNAHLEVLKLKPSPSSQHHISLARQPTLPPHRNAACPGVIVKKREKDLSLQLPTARAMPEMELNIDALLSEPQTVKLEQGVSTPEVLKPLVDTPDPESFDLLSYLCDDKVNTPPVCLEQNPFQFPQPSTSQSSSAAAAAAAALDHKRNIMVVRPLAQAWAGSSEVQSIKDKESAVIVERKPQIMPSPRSEHVEERGDDAKINVKEEKSTTHRPSRSQRKRKYSEDYLFSPSSPAEDTTWTGRRKRTPSIKTDSDEEFTLPPRRARRKSVITPILEEDDDDEEEEFEVKRKHPRTVGAVRSRQGSRTASTSSESDRYRELRDRNNEASRKSRLTRKAREQELGRQAEILTKENRILKVKVDEMENLVKKLREALLQSMMKKS